MQKQRLTKTITGTYTITLADCGYKIICNSASPFTITLPTATGAYNFDCLIQNKDAGAVTCDSKIINQSCALILSNDGGTAWHSILLDSYGGGATRGDISAGSTKITISGTPTSAVFGGGVTLDVPDATTSQKGAMSVGDGLNVSSGEVNANTNRVTTKTASATLTLAEEGIILCNHSATPIIITMPTASGNTGVWYKAVNIGAADVVSDGVALHTGDSMMAISDGTYWQHLFTPKYRVLYSQTGSQVIANTTTETSMLDGGVGSLTISANASIAGDALRIKLYGYVSTDNPAPTATIRVKYGSATIITSTATMPAGLSNELFEIEIIGTARTVGATGTAFMQGRSLIHNGSGVASCLMRSLLTTTEATFDTTVTNAFAITYQWGTASTNSTITITNGIIELLRP